MKRFMLTILAAGLVILSTGTSSSAAYVSLEGQGADRTGVVRSESPDASSEEKSYKAEVMTLEGSVFVTTSKGERVAVSEGDTLITGDVIEVSEGARVDIAFDKDWKNVTRFEGGSKFTIKSVEPAVVNLPRGSAYARLKQLPKNSSFEIQTPTAVASVRGSEYQVDVAEDGKTDVSNLSESPVYINGLDEKGTRSEAQTILKNAEFTQIIQPGARPVAPRPMTPVELRKAGTKREGVLQRIEKIKGEGRVGKIQDIGLMNRIKEGKPAELKEKGREGAENAIRGPQAQGEPAKKPEPRNLGEPYTLEPPQSPDSSEPKQDASAPQREPFQKQEPRRLGETYSPAPQPQQSPGLFEPMDGRVPGGPVGGPAEKPGEQGPRRAEKAEARKGGNQNGPRRQGPQK